MRQTIRLELHQISIDAARAVLHQQNLGQMVEHATRRLVGERFADPVVAAAALEPLLPDVKEHAEGAARAVASVTAGTMIDVAREDIELARAEVVALAREATERAAAALDQARQDVTDLAEKAAETAQQAVGEARTEVRELTEKATETAQLAVGEARAEAHEAARLATDTAQRAVAEMRQVAGGVTEAAQRAVGEARAEVHEAVRDAAEAARRAGDEARADVRQVAGDAVEMALRAVDEVRQVAGGATEAAQRAADEASAEVRQLAGKATEAAQQAVGEVREAVRQLTHDATAKAEAVVGQARAEVIELAREAAEKASAEFVPRPVEVRLPDGKGSRVTGHTHQVLPELLLALGARCHVLLVGPAGTGKSMLATHAAEALGLPLQAISLGPTTPMSKVFGYYDAHGNYHDTPFRRAFEHGGVMLLDELDNGHPGLLAELNQALALGVCAFADGMVEAHPDFRLVATGNTYGTGGDRQYVGRQALDAATLDRFVVLEVPVDETLEERVAFALAPAKKRLVRELLTEVRRLREVAADKQLPVMFSPRVSYDGARLLAAGAALEQVLSWRVIRGLSAAHLSALGLRS